MQNRPEKTFKVGNARASVFKRTNTNRSTGQSWDSYSVHLHRRYEVSEGNWESTAYFRFFELPQVALVLRLATTYVADREAEIVLEKTPPPQQAAESVEQQEPQPDRDQGSSGKAA